MKRNWTPAPARRRSPQAFATRNCVRCGGELPGENESVSCVACGRQSVVTLCPHLAHRRAWRIVRWGEADPAESKRDRDIVAVTVGDVTVHLGRFRDLVELRSEDGVRLPYIRIRAIEPGTEIIERMTHLGTCYRCAVAFFLPDCEVTAKAMHRILRVNVDRPTRQYMKPLPDPIRLSAAYLEIGQNRAEDDGEEEAEA